MKWISKNWKKNESSYGLGGKLLRLDLTLQSPWINGKKITQIIYVCMERKVADRSKSNFLRVEQFFSFSAYDWKKEIQALIKNLPHHEIELEPSLAWMITIFYSKFDPFDLASCEVTFVNTLKPVFQFNLYGRPKFCLKVKRTQYGSKQIKLCCSWIIRV